MLLFQMLIILAILLLFVTSNTASANIYHSYTDDGVLYFTNVPISLDDKKVIYTNKSTAKPKLIKTSFKTSPKHKRMIDINKDPQILDVINEKSQLYNVDPKLVHSVIKHESNWNHLAISPKGALGIMQLMPSTAADMGVINPFDPVQNIEGGIKYLSLMIEMFNGNIPLALAAYNAGPKTVQRVGKVPSIAETLNYVRNVMRDYQGTFEFTKVQKDIIYKIINPDGTMYFTNVPGKRF